MAKYKIYIDHDTSLTNDELNNNYANYSNTGIVALDFQYQGDGPLYIKKANNPSFKHIPMHLGNTRINISKEGLKNRLPQGVQSAYNNIGSPSQYFSYIGSGLTNGSTAFGTFVGN